MADVCYGLFEMFVGDNLPARWKSPVIIGPGYSNLKTYKDLYIRYEGEVIIKIYMDGKLVNTKELPTTEMVYNLKLTNKQCYGIEIETIGTGEILEMELREHPREK